MNILQNFLQLGNNDILNKIYNYLGKHPIIEKTNFKKIIDECNYLQANFVDYYFNVVLVDDFYFDNFNDDDGAEEYFLY